jgi:hypothetical protein
MDAATLYQSTPSRPVNATLGRPGGRLINAAEYSDLLVSHRRMVRVDRRAEHVRGLRDLDTGEVFLIDERRLFDGRR